MSHIDRRGRRWPRSIAVSDLPLMRMATPCAPPSASGTNAVRTDRDIIDSASILPALACLTQAAIVTP
jgi:hypothetical protein